MIAASKIVGWATRKHRRIACISGYRLKKKLLKKTYFLIEIIDVYYSSKIVTQIESFAATMIPGATTVG
jgi:hypothetical protein